MITNLTTQAVVHCWDENSIPADATIDNILGALHHPFNAEISSTVQMQMFATVKRWWDMKKPEQKIRIRSLLSKEAIQANANHERSDPSTLNNPKGPAVFEGSAPETTEPPKTVGVQILENIVGDLNKIESTITMAVNGTVKDIQNLLQSSATPGIPNPIDRALSMIGGDPVEVFKNIPIQQIKAAEGMGNLMKEVVIGELANACRTVDNVASTVSTGVSNAARGLADLFSKPLRFF